MPEITPDSAKRAERQITVKIVNETKTWMGHLFARTDLIHGE